MVTTNIKDNLIQSIIDFNKWCAEYPEWKGTNKELKGIFYTKLVKNIKACPESQGIDYFTPNNIFILEIENGVISKLYFGYTTGYSSTQDLVNVLSYCVKDIDFKAIKSNLPFEYQINTILLEVNNYKI